MLEGLVAWVLNNYLGKYVSNLNTDQLSVALLKGAVELENLPLKKDALKELLPFEVKAGFIGKITLQIPFYRPHIDPWVISVSKLHLIGSPEKQEDFDEERERLFERENKKAFLLALEEKWKKEREQVAESYWYSVTASIVARIVENIELNIQDVHLRFEDGITNASQPFAFGVCIKNVSVQNAVNEPVEELMKKKQLDIADFSIYWDTDCALLGDLPPGELQEAMDKSMESRDHNYIMEPLRTSALLKRNCSKEPLRSRNTPRLEFDIQLETIPLKLSQTQYQQIMDFLKELDRKERQIKFRRWKPKVTVSGNCREWWLFALNAHLAEIREQKERSSWEFALHRAQDVVSYTDLYYKKLREVQLSDEEQEEMERIEDEQTFEELKILCEIVYNRFRELAESIKEPLPETLEEMSEIELEASSSSSSSGMLQYLQSWFPGWGGWYGDSQEALENDSFEGLLSETSEQWRPEDVAGADELFDPAADVSNINTFTKRDHVFAKLNLQLQGGSVTLLHTERKGLQTSERAFMQLEFSGVTILAETLPRRNSSLFKVQLGSLFLRDLVTEGTIFPFLVFPNPQKEVGCASSIGLRTFSSDTSNQSTADPLVPVFEMVYERNPVRSNFERRLEVSTQPLNIIYNPQAIKKVADFFYKGRVHTSGFGCQSELELRVAEAARRQYNKLKMQTKAEIRQTIDRLLVGDFIEDSKRWTVCLDISAPQVIFPDDFKFADPVLVVIDLGRMLLTNSQEEDKKKSSGGPSSELSELSDDEYKTPLATPPRSPPPEASMTNEDKTFEFTGVEMSEEQWQAHLMSKKMYDTYSLSFMDLQIMVGRVKDNWKYAQDINVGPTHVVEKFNVHLQLERRLIYTSDPKYPGAVLSGNLPDLKIHINEDKIMALNNCFGRLTTSDAEMSGASQMGKWSSSADLDQRGSLHSSVVNLTQSVMIVEQHTKEVLVESQLLLAEFQVNCMQLGVESNGRYISVLKVFGTNAHFVKRPYDAEVSLTVHGLLLVDTMQTFGSDFDLLMASHKNLSFDVPTGSLRDSRAQSPIGEPGAAHPIDGVRLAKKCAAASSEPPGSFPQNDESLIKLEYQFVSAECPSMNLDSTLQVISVQMNNLDIILNPETIVELIGFLQKSFPKENGDSSPQPLMTDSERSFSEQEIFQSTHAQNTEVAVDIHWLNILLLRTVTMINGEKLGRKIATASIGGTKVNVSMGSRLDINGSLGCLHLMDLTQDNIKNQYVVSIGNTVRYENLLCDVSYFKPAFLQFDESSSLPDALSFTFTKQLKEECSLQLRMASLHYNHSAKFLKEITLSLDELEENFRSMLKSAATKVTIVLATKTAKYSEMVSLFDTTPRSRDPFNLESNEGEEFPPVHSKTETIKLILNVNIESPVVSIPRKPGSSELLVGHLGQISIQNFVAGEDGLRSDRLQVEIRDIKMYSLNSSHLAGKKEGPPEKPPSGIASSSSSSQEDSQFTRHDFFESLHKGHAFHILNNATIQFNLEKIPVESDAELAFSMNDDIEISSLMRIVGKFVNPLQVVLAKHVYEQVLQTLDNLVCNEDLTKPPSGFPSSTYPSSSSPSASLHSTSTDFSFDRKENGLFSHSSFNTSAIKFAPVKEVAQSFTQIQATFHISELQVQLSADLTLGAQGLVSLKFQDFDIEFGKDHPHTLSIQIALRSLLMEDLLEKNPDSVYKNLMVSRGAPKPSSLAHKEYLSQSCPLVSNVEYPDMPRSLPSHMEEAPNVFQLYQRPTCVSHKKHKEDADSDYPLTPPPSPTTNKSNALSGKSDFDDSLVHINVLLVDKKHPGFSSCYGKINRSVDVDFNCLDVLITLQTWVVILDFFGIGSTAENHSMKSQPEDVQHPVKTGASVFPASEVQDAVNTKVDLKVHSLSLVLNKTTNELAKANVSKLVTHVEMIEGDLALHGSIGSLSLSDLTSHGEFYRERFTTSGEEALIFQVHKYGRPDPVLQRDCDMRVSLRMASVRYVHTHRFQAEVVSFIQHFTQLQDVLGRQRAAIEGQTVRDQAQRAARVLLDIEAGAPVLLIPESSRSNHLIVANLGKLKVKNRFLFAGTSGTFSLKDKIQFQVLDIRLSYNDVQLFLAIAKSIPGQTSNAVSDSSASDIGVSVSVASSNSSWVNEISELASESMETSKHTLDPVLELQLARLQELGFSIDDCRKALLDCKGQLKKAASWLFKNAEPLKPSLLETSNRDSPGSVILRLISGVEIKADSICICFIDDCMDCDVPLAELTFSRLNFLQHLRANSEGYAHFTLSGDYYNRELSGWEPFIEPWPCSVSWQQQPASRLHPSRLKLEVKAKRRLDINITSVLIEQYTKTKQSWMADYCKQEKEVEEVESEEWMGSSVDPPSFGQGLPLVYLRTRSTASLTNLEHQMYARAEMKTSKRRHPFVPFALRNHTGCTLWFATLTTTPTRAALSHSGSPGAIPEENGTFLDGAHKVSEWHEVLTGEEVPFAFEAKGKLRHRHTHDLRIHQLQVRVNGWEPVSPVSVDKVGIFFRYAAPDKSTSFSTVGSPINRTNIIHPQVYFSSLPPVRVVFAVTMEGSARKVITVRSALIVKNKLEIPMELRLDSPSAPDKPVVLPSVMPGDCFAIPLHLTSWRLQARPKGMGVFFCKSPIHWTNVQKTSEVSSSKRECHAMESENSRFFRFCVAIKKENYPDYMPSSIFSDSAKQIFRQPGHTIYLLPTVVICNLLPCELEFYVKGMPINGTLKPGKEALLHTADTSQNIELGVSLENFTHCKELLIPPGTQNYMVRMRLYDVNKRLFNLTIRIVCRAEGSLKIFISAPYWLINKTGLPLIFRQDNAKIDGAGQFEEHELARSLSPLLFCYADKEQPNLCTMRVGRGIHPEGMPGWCQGFSLDGGSGVRALKVIQQANRPGLIYNIGIDVKKGRGRYIDTCMVTFAPRYLLDNKSMHKLAFAQRAFARGQGTTNPDGYISTLPGSSVVFHWPRNDLDQLLCVRLMDVPNCIWSGGFQVNKNNSFHINMRDTVGKCYFLRVEITLKGATYRVSFSDTDQLPPTFRIDNFSKVPVVFTQHGVAEPRLSTEVKAAASLDYAWDEPTLKPFITLTVKGAGSSEVTCCMDDFQESKQLYYENFIYIAATYTFSGLQEETGRPIASNKEVDCAELVLDVCSKTQRVVLKKKEPGKRSQLWRMTGTGMLCHEGSAVPHHPNKPSPPRITESSMILDIAGLAAVTDNRYEPLMLRKPDRRRSTTQTWSFREGKLVCGMHGLVVQAKGGIAGLHDGAEVVLGPDTSLEMLGPVPPEQQFINQKMRPGSGILAVRVIPDGPTRVLQITDFNQRRNDRFSYEGDELEQDLRKLKNPDTEQELEVQLKLEGGIGLSVVNKAPEELIFASFTGINVHFTQLSTNQVLELSIQDVQVDNQLLHTTQPFMLFVTPKMDENEFAETGPALQLNAMKFPSKSPLTDIYKHLMVTASKFTVQIEEKLLLKLLSFFGCDQSESEVENYDENLHEKPVDQGGAQKRYYFENLKISVPQIKLSVFTSSKLPLDLKALKSTLGFPLIRFEDAVINLDPFTRVHPYETKEFIVNDILKHFQEELISQAVKILSSVDFLGNPMGLLNDVSEGVTGLIKYGNVGGLIRNITHGVTNSAAKVAGTLSDGLGKTMDNRHQTEREFIRYHAATSGEHLVAGIHGLTHGIIGGLTSVITSTIEGVKTEGGVSGFISGLGKGLVGTVTKPVAGALDFASETAQAMRETTAPTAPRTQAERVRKPRCCMGPQGLLPRYSEIQAEGQELLFKLTDNDEFFIAVENIDSYCVLISSKTVFFLNCVKNMDREAIFLEVKYDDLFHCLISKDHGKVYVQLTKKAVNSSSGVSMPGPSHQRPMVHVTAEEPAVKLCQAINYAKSLFYEQQLMLRSSEHQEQLELDS
ncbi:intermembrane lipid transfer protein VPS13D isoform X9 [Elgaria multicarinata webbii]|uniref:intermembrane lipid transfer protein VPS13D isoform X9 n=1 Tax=Elgaria multicarinata webbii TaxID=159646 RepID=UPI002FCD3642